MLIRVPFGILPIDGPIPFFLPSNTASEETFGLPDVD